MTRQSLWLLAYGLWFVAFVSLGLPKAVGRHFHVDELQVAYNAALWSIHGLPDYTNYTSPYVVPLAWLVRGFDHAADMLIALRVVFLFVFMLVLVACAWTQPYFTSHGGRLGVLAAASLFHPLWFNGIEIRHDVLIVLGTVLLYGLAQRAATTPSHRLVGAAGFVCACMQMNSTKSVVYWAPLGALLVGIETLHAWPLSLRERARPVLWFCAGLLAGLLFNAAVLLLDGELVAYLGQYSGFARTVHRASRASYTVPDRWTELLRVARGSSLMFGLALSSCAMFVLDLTRRRVKLRTAITMGGMSWVALTLAVNPRPYPYNLLYLLPFVLFAALDALARISQHATRRARLFGGAAVAAAAIAIFARGWTSEPFLRRTNHAQLSYVDAAEALTSKSDTVLDAVGMVLTRKPPHQDWMLHSLFMSDYRRGSRASFAQILTDHPSPVLIDNYRWGWLSEGDLALRQQRYVRLAPRLLVLGAELVPGRGDIAIHHAGRYRVTASDADGMRVSLDGKALRADETVFLTLGTHRYDMAASGRALLHWIGPNISAGELPAILSLGRDERFFTNEPAMIQQTAD